MGGIGGCMGDYTIQEAMLDLIEACGHWNAFNGPAIVRDLRAQRGLWRSVVFVGPGAQVHFESGAFVREERDFSAHRGLPEILYGFDILQLTSVFGREQELESLANTWGADSVDWYGLPLARTAVEDGDEAAYVLSGGDPQRVVLELWWD
jgi:hypothetical protein